MLQRHMAESRILMTLAMAFFSIALTLNLTGVRLNQLKLSDLSPSALATSLSHQYYTTSAHLTRYYLNLRIVYELESRVNEMMPKSNSAPAAQPATQQQQKPQPQAKPSSGGKPGGSARKDGSDTPAEQRKSAYEAPVPVLALFAPHAKTSNGPHPHLQVWTRNEFFSSGPMFLFEKPGNHHKPIERSLV
jgi:hypothetical protein